MDLTPWIAEHGQAALMVSGGKDSMACLTLLKPWWGTLTVYWSNPGVPLPETLELMQRVYDMVPTFIEVRSDVLTDIGTYGWPVDLVPHSLTPLGQRSMGTDGIIVRDRMECCFTNLMAPVYDRALNDGHRLMIRGQRNDEVLTNPALHTGYVDEHGITHLLPIAEWTAEQTLAYLKEHAPELIHPIYAAGGRSSLDCVCCTAYWGEGHTRYLLDNHPEAGQNRLKVIEEVLRHTEQATAHAHD